KKAQQEKSGEEAITEGAGHGTAIPRRKPYPDRKQDESEGAPSAMSFEAGQARSATPLLRGQVNSSDLQERTPHPRAVQEPLPAPESTSSPSMPEKPPLNVGAPPSTARRAPSSPKSSQQVGRS